VIVDLSCPSNAEAQRTGPSRPASPGSQCSGSGASIDPLHGAGYTFLMKWLEFLSQRATDFVSSHWGTLTALGVLAMWLVAIPFLGPSKAWGLVDKIIFATSFLLLFLLQRSQTKATLSIQVKLNELLASTHRASSQMINVENKSEEEVREIHDRYQKIQQKGLGSHSIDDTSPDHERNPPI
jgi:low affinity Fe/Cu permease